MPTTNGITAAAALSSGQRPLAIPNPIGIGAGKVIGWIVSGITKAINTFFGGLVKDALNPLLKLLGQTLLTTPNPNSLPRMGHLWESSREIAVAAYALLILVAAILVMAYETVQTRHGVKEIAPRIVIGFLAANMSLLLAGKAVSFANALSTGVLSGGVNPKSAASTLTSLVMNAVTNGGIFLIFIGIALACILLALLVCYVIRVALTVILIAGAPLALMCHALPQTEGIARWWWRAFAGVLAIQIAQSLTLVAALNVFLAKGGFTFFGPTKSGLVDLIVTLALLYILFKIPFWILHSIQVGGGRSFIGSAVKGVIAYKTLGLLGLRARTAAGQGGRPGGGPGPGLGRGRGGPPSGPGGPPVPLGGGLGAGRGRTPVRRPPARPATIHRPARPSRTPGVGQLTLPFADAEPDTTQPRPAPDPTTTTTTSAGTAPSAPAPRLAAAPRAATASSAPSRRAPTLAAPPDLPRRPATGTRRATPPRQATTAPSRLSAPALRPVRPPVPTPAAPVPAATRRPPATPPAATPAAAPPVPPVVTPTAARSPVRPVERESR